MVAERVTGKGITRFTPGNGARLTSVDGSVTVTRDSKAKGLAINCYLTDGLSSAACGRPGALPLEHHVSAGTSRRGQLRAAGRAAAVQLRQARIAGDRTKPRLELGYHAGARATTRRMVPRVDRVGYL